MSCKFGSSLVLLSGGSRNFQPRVRTQNFIEYPPGFIYKDFEAVFDVTFSAKCILSPLPVVH